MDIFRTIAERKILEAAGKGMLENLPGNGKPLVFEDETWIPEDLRTAYRILKNSGFVPPELELRKEIINLRSLIDTVDDDKVRLKKMRELNYKILCLNMSRKQPLNLGAFPKYENMITSRMISD